MGVGEGIGDGEAAGNACCIYTASGAGVGDGFCDEGVGAVAGGCEVGDEAGLGCEVGLCRAVAAVHNMSAKGSIATRARR